MTSNNEIRLVRSGGVSCKSDAGLYRKDTYRTTLRFLSVYGSPQQVRAVFALLVRLEPVEVVDVEQEVFRSWYDSLKLKTFPLGYGKRHGLIFTEDFSKKVIFWTSPEEKERRLLSFLSRRRIPLDRQWLPLLEEILIEDEQLIPLSGWGGFSGYDVNLGDDRVCDLIVEKILPLRGDWREQWSLESSSRSMVLSSPLG